jgi:hypothetical protein
MAQQFEQNTTLGRDENLAWRQKSQQLRQALNCALACLHACEPDAISFRLLQDWLQADTVSELYLLMHTDQQFEKGRVALESYLNCLPGVHPEHAAAMSPWPEAAERAHDYLVHMIIQENTHE